jgi:hypothetical protein
MVLLVISFITIAASAATLAISLALIAAWFVFNIATAVVDFAVSVVRSRWRPPMQPPDCLRAVVSIRPLLKRHAPARV